MIDNAEKIKYLFLDVDGTLTDGKIYMSESGELFKAFDVKDGCGIKDILPRIDVTPVIITARKSKILEIRCKELGVDYYYQGIRDKEWKIHEIMREIDCKMSANGTYDCAAFMGDDILDLKPMKICAVKSCPADAVDQVKSVCDFVSTKNAGAGAVRQFIDLLYELKNKEG